MADFPKLRGLRIEVHELRKKYDGYEVLKGINFEVDAGEIFVVLGPRGSGKSVLLRQLAGLEKPDEGEVLVEGQPMQPPERGSRYRVATVFQSDGLFTSLTVGENVGFYLAEHHMKSPDEIAWIVSKNLELVGLKGTEDLMPNELSNDMKMHVAIARSLAIEPQLILYDEPTSEIEPLSALEIAEGMVKLNNRLQMTFVVVSRSCKLSLGIANRVALLDEGSIIAIGTPDEIRRCSDPHVQKLLNIPEISKCLPSGGLGIHR